MYWFLQWRHCTERTSKGQGIYWELQSMFCWLGQWTWCFWHLMICWGFSLTMILFSGNVLTPWMLWPGQLYIGQKQRQRCTRNCNIPFFRKLAIVIALSLWKEKEPWLRVDRISPLPLHLSLIDRGIKWGTAVRIAFDNLIVVAHLHFILQILACLCMQ